MRLKQIGMAGLAVVTTGALGFGLLGGSGIASAQTPPGPGQSQGARVHRGLEGLANMLGVTVDQLRNATKQQRDQMIDQALASGKITKAQADRLKGGPQMDRSRGPSRQGQMPRPGSSSRGAFMGLSDPIATLAGSMGITKEDLEKQLKDGKSLAEIGAEKGRTPEMLKNTVITQWRGDLATMVKDGKLSQRVADQFLSAVDRVALRLINAKHGQFQPGQFFGPGGPRPQGMPQRPR